MKPGLHTGKADTKAILRAAAPYIVLLIPILLIYLNALPNDFVWDDDILIVDNYLVRSWRHLPTIFTQSFFHMESQGMPAGNYYRPFILLSFLIEHSLWGLRPAGYHLTNVLLHCSNVLLFFHFFTRIFQDKRAGFLAGLFYGTNPVHTTAVSFIGGRTDSFAAFFFLISLVLYQRFRRPVDGGRTRQLAGALIFFCLSLLCKESAVMLPLIVVLYDICLTDRFRKGRFEWRSLGVYAPFAAIWAGYFCLRRFVVQENLDFVIHSPSDLLYRLATIIKAIAYYWKLLLLPIHLSTERAVEVVHSLGSPLFLFSLAAMGVFFGLMVYWWRSDRRRFFCSMWFFITLLPASNIVPVFPSIASSHLYAAEQLMYVPSMGLFMLAASFLPIARGNAASSRRTRLTAHLCLAVSLAVVFEFSVLTIRRNTDWRDNLTFYERTLSRDPTSVRIMNNLGILYTEQGQYQKALELFESALKVRPDSVSVYNNIAAVYEELGLRNQAEAAYREVLSLDEKNIRARLGMGKLLVEAGRIEEAKREFSLLTGWYPKLSAAHHELGRLLMAQGKDQEALAEFQAALENSPSPDVVLNSIGIIYARQDDLEQASRYFKLALEANPDSYQANVNLGNIYFVQGLDEKALEQYEAALRKGLRLPAIQQRVTDLRARLSQGGE